MNLNQIIDWKAFVLVLLPAYEGLANEGRPPYSSFVILKMLVIAVLYNLSERQTVAIDDAIRGIILTQACGVR